MNFENTTLANDCPCLSWRPIFAGSLVAIGLSFLLKLFSVAIGLTAYNTTNGAETLVIGGLIGTTIAVVASMFAAGWIAGFLGVRSCSKRHLGALYGFLTWCIALIASILLAGPVMHYIMIYTHFISGNIAPLTNMIGMQPLNEMAKNGVPEAPSITISAYILFGLFFISAFSCSLGGHCGMQHRCKAE